MTKPASSAERPSASRARRHPRGAAPTLHDVAREAGVSLATASRVLNGSERKVAESFRERVESAAAELGYTANVSAQSTARGTSPVIALLVADIADPYFGLIASGVARGADEHGLVVTIAITERDPERESRIVRALRGQRPRGLILAASRTQEPREAETAHDLAEFARLGGRVVAFGPDGDAERRIEIDNRAAAEDLGRRMAGLGYRSALALAAAEGVRTSDDRLAGFRAGFEAAGGVVAGVRRGDFRRESGAADMTEALADGVPAGTLVFAISDVVAIGAMSAIRDAGRDVGADIAVCGFDDVPASSDVTPALTTVRVPLSEVGYQAFRATVDADWEQPPLPLEVVVRASTPGITA
ncbi:LacI family DNA-binding transcriptional regulator [Microbacterium sp. MYb66]|uniref:LacI family DNA-binding transcriptional regulator n=1 Tax=Microbacterium sp. MYb66 TaxID=1848692 RepID=UPI000D00AEE2|nr:LacI family DNA-binding transcriptional regulator [Microbacterium sp. MYb66]PRA80327.1 LacI family transcriptional regulator [Microbacterium sp. MYb66]